MLVGAKLSENTKREHEKSSKPFVLSLEHKQSSILARRPKSFSSEAGKFEIRNSAAWHSTPLRALPKSTEAYNLNNVCNAALTSADRHIAYPRTFTVTHKQSITTQIVPQDVPNVKSKNLYIVSFAQILCGRYKMCVYVSNTSIIRTGKHSVMLMRIIAVLFPLWWI